MRQQSAHRFLLGMAVSALSLQPGECRTRAELAAFTDVSRSAIGQIEDRALRKLRRGLSRELARQHLEIKIP